MIYVCSGGSNEAPGTCGLLLVQIISLSLQFSLKVKLQSDWWTPFRVGAPTHGKSWIRHWAHPFITYVWPTVGSSTSHFSGIATPWYIYGLLMGSYLELREQLSAGFLFWYIRYPLEIVLPVQLGVAGRSVQSERAALWSTMTQLTSLSHISRQLPMSVSLFTLVTFVPVSIHKWKTLVKVKTF